MVARHHRIPRVDGKSGFTLVEVMVGFTLLALLASGLTASVLQARRLAEENVLDSTALTAGLGYLEQMKSLRYEDLEAVAADGGTVATRLNAGTPDALELGTENARRVLVDLDADGKPRRWMDLWVTPEIRNLAGAGGVRALELELHARWASVDGKRMHQRTFRYVRSWVGT